MLELPLNERLGLITENSVFHILSSLQFDKKALSKLFKLTDKIRKIAKTKKGLDWLQTLLSHKRAVLYFAQPSTRTYLSFNNACQILGIKTSDIRSTETSSETKGESLEDTLETFHSYADLIIIRHANEHIAEKAAWAFNNSDKPIPVINAGSGPNEHPTQALLDVYTIHKAFKGEVDGKSILMIGDLKRGRTIRSLTYLMSNFKDIKFIYTAPGELSLAEDIRDFLMKNDLDFDETDNFEESLKKADIIYPTRIQDEYDAVNESRSIDYSKFYLKKEHLSIIKENSIILHPLPRRKEIDTAIDSDPRAWYWQQEVNGMWVRTALIGYIFQIHKKILSH